MRYEVPTRDVPFRKIILISKLEEEVLRAALSFVDEKGLALSVSVELVLKAWAGYPVKVINNASDALPGSADALDAVNEYLAARDDADSIIDGKCSLDFHVTFSPPKMVALPSGAGSSKGAALPAAQQGSKPVAKSSRNGADDAPQAFLPLKPRYSFEQIILPDATRRELDDAVKVIECKDLIYNVWGFADVDPVPRSILNFYGEPGTGKTMCAHAIAQRLGKRIMALNYSEIESKFVGEAPKNLKRAFETAAQTDSVLFFDEADSFLGKRIENVTQGSDQALNSLRSQMLILLEEFAGVVLFATNLVTNFDPAFESRILKHIRFDLPNKEARVAILRKMLPPRLPLAAPITDEQLAEASDIIEGFSGREIKGAVLDLLLSKADKDNPSVTFSFDDIKAALIKKVEAKRQLKSEEEQRIKKKIERKLKEKALEGGAAASEGKEGVL